MYESYSSIAWGLARTSPYGSRLLALFSFLLALAIFVVCARLYARRIAHRGLGWDDWLILGAVVRHTLPSSQDWECPSTDHRHVLELSYRLLRCPNRACQNALSQHQQLRE